jgi:PBP1b-binding outer membrane lipoprotein LpoB
VKLEILIAFAIACALLMSGCMNQRPQAASNVTEACVNACRDAKKAGADLGSGPCLSNNISKDWVCDVAHNPRADVDSIPENQCSAYGKQASHFVEVTPECEFIRAV